MKKQNSWVIEVDNLIKWFEQNYSPNDASVARLKMDRKSGTVVIDIYYEKSTKQ